MKQRGVTLQRHRRVANFQFIFSNGKLRRYRNVRPEKSRFVLPNYCFSYSPFPSFFSTVKPADFASLMDSGLSFKGELNVEMSLRTGFLQAGHLVSSGADNGLLSVNEPPQILHSPSQS